MGAPLANISYRRFCRPISEYSLMGRPNSEYSLMGFIRQWGSTELMEMSKGQETKPVGKLMQLRLEETKTHSQTLYVGAVTV